MRKKIGRIELRVGLPGDGSQTVLLIPSGWNDSSELVSNELTIEELRDIHYMIGRALAMYDSERDRGREYRAMEIASMMRDSTK